MKVQRLAIPDVILVEPARYSDARGFFSETYVYARFAAAGIDAAFVQDNQSLSVERGTVRGLHCQIGRYAQGKLVRCVRGAVWDVAIDLREGSPTYRQHVCAVLSAENWQQLWIPAGFLHGFCTLEPRSEVIYKVTAPYDRDSERGVIWNDPDLDLPWPVGPDVAVLSDKDRKLPPLAEAGGWFRYPG